jgi:hypothetical protein
MGKPPIYRQSASYAREHGELDAYRESKNANIACKQAVEKSIRENYHDNRLNTDSVQQVAAEFGFERLMYVLANSVQRKDYDGRFSRDNKAWAQTISVCEDTNYFGEDRRCEFEVDSHPGLTDMFVTRARKEYQLAKEQKENHSKAVRHKKPGMER